MLPSVTDPGAPRSAPPPWKGSDPRTWFALILFGFLGATLFIPVFADPLPSIAERSLGAVQGFTLTMLGMIVRDRVGREK